MFPFLTMLLSPLGWLYGAIVRCRNFLYDSGVFTLHTFSKPVISVGNLTVGGTGKTPLVSWLAETLREQGWQPGIVSRGYGRHTKNLVVVHNGQRLLVGVADAGDEPYLLARLLGNVPVVVDSDRVRGIRAILKDGRVDVVILDDGFQHRRAARDLDLLLINSREPRCHYALLPGGRLRESLGGAGRADLILYTKSTDHRLPAIHDTLARHSRAQAVTVGLQPRLLRYTRGRFSPAEATHQGLFAFCGIGDPDSFTTLCRDINLRPIAWKFFRDHQKYTPTVVHRLQTEINAAQCTAILTTEKDLVKLPDNFLESFDVFVIRIDLAWTPQEREILTALLEKTIIQTSEEK